MEGEASQKEPEDCNDDNAAPKSLTDDESAFDRYGFFLDAQKATLEIPEAEKRRRRAKEKSRLDKWNAMLGTGRSLKNASSSKARSHF